MSAKSTRLTVRRELDRAMGNVEWAGRHCMYVHAKCEEHGNDELSMQCEMLITMLADMKHAMLKLQSQF